MSSGAPQVRRLMVLCCFQASWRPIIGSGVKIAFSLSGIRWKVLIFPGLSGLHRYIIRCWEGFITGRMNLSRLKERQCRNSSRLGRRWACSNHTGYPTLIILERVIPFYPSFLSKTGSSICQYTPAWLLLWLLSARWYMDCCIWRLDMLKIRGLKLENYYQQNGLNHHLDPIQPSKHYYFNFLLCFLS